jgi:fatty-acyl-CoA synthase
MDLWPQPLLDLLSARGAEPVFEQGDRVVSGDEMMSLIRRIAAGLRAAGVSPGDGVVMQLSVAPETFAAIVAAFAVGARVAGVRPDQLRHVMTTSGGLLIDDAALPSLLSVQDRPLAVSGRPGDIGRIVYTSGSTGRPKGCCQTYAAISAREQAVPSRWSPGTRSFAERMSRFLVFGSLSAQVMFEYSVLAIASGGMLVAAEPPIYPEAVAKLRATAGVITVGRLHQLVKAQRAEPADLSSLQGLMVSGSPIEPARLADALDVLGPVLFNGYGQTEADDHT